MIALLAALAGAMGVALLSELAFLDATARPTLWILSVVFYPALDALVARLAPQPRRLSAQVALFLTVDAVITCPLGWARWVRVDQGWDETTLPLFALLVLPSIALGLAASPWIYRRWRRSELVPAQTFPGWLLDRARILLAPLLLVTGLASLASWIEATALYSRLSQLYPGIDAGMSALALTLAFVVSPFLVLLAWRTERFPPGPMRDILTQQAKALGVSLADIRVWDQRTRYNVNACALGLIPGTRRVIFTRGLLEFFSPDQVVAVFTHEIAHLRCRHLPAFAAMGLGLMLSLPLCDALTSLALKQLPAEAAAAATAAYVAGFALLGLGWISRRFETEADLIAARATGFTAYTAALGKLAMLLGSEAAKRGWRHPSVASRLDLLARSESDPSVLAAELKRGSRLRCGIWCWLGIVAVATATSVAWLQPPVADLRELATAQVEAAERYGVVAEAARDRVTRTENLSWLARDSSRIASKMSQRAGAALHAIVALRAADPVAAGDLLERWKRLPGSNAP